ncbi:unnamed protein product [Closterium sp. NIES-53]
MAVPAAPAAPAAPSPAAAPALPALPAPLFPLPRSPLFLPKQAASLPTTAVAASATTPASHEPFVRLTASLHSPLSLLISLLLSELVPCRVSRAALSLLLLGDSLLPSSAAAANSNSQEKRQQQQEQHHEEQVRGGDAIRNLSTRQIQIFSTLLRHILTYALPTNQQQQLNLMPRRTTLPSPSSSPSFLLSPLLPPPISSKQQGAAIQVWQQGVQEGGDEELRGGVGRWSQVQRVQEGLRRMQQELQQRLALSAIVTAALCHSEESGNEMEGAERKAAGGGKAAGREAAGGEAAAGVNEATRECMEQATRECMEQATRECMEQATRECMEQAAVNSYKWVLSQTTHTTTAAAAAAVAAGGDASSVGLNRGTQEQTRAAGATVLMHPLLTTCALTFAHRSGLTTPDTLPSPPHTPFCAVTLKPINATQSVWHCLSCSGRISTEGMLCLDACRPFFLTSGRQKFWVRAEAWAERFIEACEIAPDATAGPEVCKSSAEASENQPIPACLREGEVTEEVTGKATLVREEEVTAAAAVAAMPVCPFCGVQAVAPSNPQTLLSPSLV